VTYDIPVLETKTGGIQITEATSLDWKISVFSKS
jgi:hypothetical protein